MNRWKMLFIVVMLVGCVSQAHATDVTFEFVLPSTDCEGNTVDQSLFGALEVYLSTSPIPGSDLVCSGPIDPPVPGPDDDIIFVRTNSVPPVISINLVPGTMYHIRFRVQGPGGIWTNMSKETEYFVPFVQVHALTLDSVST